MDAQPANDRLLPEERLFGAVMNGSPVPESEWILREVEDVDTRGVHGRTALYLAVQGGHVKWVEKLFEKGANPRLADTDGKDVLHVAEEMEAKSTDDTEREDREWILKLVRVVHQRMGIPVRSQSQCQRAQCSSHDLNELDSIKEMMARQCKALKEDFILNVVREIETPREIIAGLKRELESRDALLISLQSRVSALVEKYANLEGVVRGRREAAEVPVEKPVNEGG
ncbi:uncharacterized protein [Hetaerina americana]|uniref:uncharacterized protein n=1 Tax=Hetaerina americana TaxID=62018 RepID=UPI003A7F5454